MKLDVVQAKLDDVEELAANLRPEDRAELEHASQMPARDVLLDGYGQSMQVNAVRLHGRCVALGGAVPDIRRRVAAPWLAASPELVQEAPVEFCRRIAREGWIEDSAKGFPVLTNIVDGRNQVHIRWLKWAGFNFHEYPRIINGVPFWRFYKNVYP